MESIPNTHRKPKLNVETCDVSVMIPPGKLDRSGMATIFAAFVFHVLFMRGQIPEPFTVMEAAYGEMSEIPKGFKEKSAHRKISKYINSVRELLTDVRQVFLSAPAPPDKASLLLGTSAACPREAFTLHFERDTVLEAHTGGDETAEKVAANPRTVDAIKRRVLRELVTQWLGGKDGGRIRLLNLFISVRLPQTTASALLPSLPTLRCVCSFRYRLRRSAPPALCCTLQADDQDERSLSSSDDGRSGGTEGELSANGADARADELWLVSKRAVRALRTQNSVSVLRT